MISYSRPRTVLALVLVSVAGCTPSGAGNAKRDVSVPTPTPTTMTQLHLPIESYLLDYRHQSELEVIGLRWRDACVEAKGFTPPTTTDNADQAAARYVRLWQYYDTRRYAISDAATAREYGYQLPPLAFGSAKPVSLGSLSEPLRDATIKCDREADKEEQREGLAVDQKLSATALNLKSKDFTASQSDPRVHGIFEKWSACMAGEGYSYAAPLDAANDGRWKQSGQGIPAQASSQETNSAVAAVGCVYETNVLGVCFAVEAEYENRDIEKNAGALTKLKAQNNRAARAIDKLWLRGG
jgi:hypothetical protein